MASLASAISRSLSSFGKGFVASTGFGGSVGAVATSAAPAPASPGAAATAGVGGGSAGLGGAGVGSGGLAAAVGVSLGAGAVAVATAVLSMAVPFRVVKRNSAAVPARTATERSAMATPLALPGFAAM